MKTETVSKGSKSAAKSPEVVDAAESAKAEANAIVAPDAPPTATDKKALAVAFLASESALVAAEKALDEARNQRSKVTEQIVRAYGHKGPFTIGGKNWAANARKGELGGFTMRELPAVKDSLD